MQWMKQTKSVPPVNSTCSSESHLHPRPSPHSLSSSRTYTHVRILKTPGKPYGTSIRTILPDYWDAQMTGSTAGTGWNDRKVSLRSSIATPGLIPSPKVPVVIAYIFPRPADHPSPFLPCISAPFPLPLPLSCLSPSFPRPFTTVYH